MSEPTMPTFRLKVKDQDTGATAEVGAGWLNDDGTINVKLNPCVVLSYDNLKGKYLTLFVVGSQAKNPTSAARKAVEQIRAARAAAESGSE
jgi:hypothetical protein